LNDPPRMVHRSTKSADIDDIKMLSREYRRDYALEMARDGIIDADYDIRHIVVEKLSEKYNFNYMRTKNDK